MVAKEDEDDEDNDDEDDDDEEEENEEEENNARDYKDSEEEVAEETVPDEAEGSASCDAPSSKVFHLETQLSPTENGRPTINPGSGILNGIA